MGTKTRLNSADGFEFAAYEAMPGGRPRAGLVVIQEVFGVNGHIREVADGYAGEGYAVVAPQIFDRVEPDVELGYTEADMGRGIELAFQELQMQNTLADLQAAINQASQHGKVGVVGYCFGGLLTWLSACELDGVAAASCYYGGGIAGEAGRTPGCPVIMHFGELDAHIPMSDVDQVREAQPDVPIHVYNADHGFNCDHRGSYDAPSAALARERTLAFFAENLG
ncbi:MAG: dienelactone hydrolase family protein [Gammaproteobacteria bacterium]|nr:dienelactone hydrolase family protein [Gammaproteobacteria bacterium]MDE0367818.1 dienelactone hydrolase family protein [Gammaproteobacteria bacterium]